MADRKVVAIAGKAPTTRDFPNHEPDSVEIWGLSDGYKQLRRHPDRWFEIHTPDPDGVYRGFTDWKEGGAEQHLAWLMDCGIPVYTNKVDDRIPTSIAFPYGEIGARYRPYWTSTVAYMLSLAAYEGVDEIHLWGVEMAAGTEYDHQRPGAEYWLGILEAQGCAVYIPDCSPLLKPMGATYGITTRQPLDAGSIMDEISGLDAQIVLNGSTPERIGGRKALTNLLIRANSAQRGKIIEPLVTLTTATTDEGELDAKRKAIRDAVLNNQ